MPVYELILSSDTIEQGRIKINDAFSATTGLWSGGTGSQSLISNNGSDIFANGDYSLAAGFSVSALTNYSQAFGLTTLSDGLASFTEGYLTYASGDYSHAEGQQTGAIGTASHAEGQLTVASGDASHAEGRLNTAYGSYSHAEGFDNEAIGTRSHAEGRQNTAYGAQSHAEGLNNIASGTSSHVEGRFNTAIGLDSHAQGYNNIVYGNQSFVGGSNNISYEQNSFILSSESTGETEYSAIIGGRENRIDNKSFLGPTDGESILGGTLNVAANGFSSVIGGVSNEALSYSTGVFVGANNRLNGGTFFANIDTSFSVILGGRYNLINATPLLGSSIYSAILGGYLNEIKDSDYSVILGGRDNYTDGYGNTLLAGAGAQSTSAYTFTMGATPGGPNPSNNTIIFEFTDGSGYWDGNSNLGPADYAEYFEWNDGNLLNEDRVGYFVSLINDKIEIGNSSVVGVVSANPAIVGDSASLKWTNTFVKDEWGRFIKDKYDVYKVGENKLEIYEDINRNVYTEIPSPTNILGNLYNGDLSGKTYLRTEYIKRVNPLYDHTQNYTPRKDRKEWSPIGLLGKLYVRTSEQIIGDKVSVDSNGMAINGTDYYVLENAKAYDGNYGIVRILFK